MTKLSFTKIHGLGNDFIIFREVDEYKEEIKNNVEKLCHRHFGIGADGIMLVEKSEAAHTKMVLFNSDGSRASMCGNGIRCFAKYVWDSGVARVNPMEIETDDGVKIAYLEIVNDKVHSVKIDMGEYSFDYDKVNLSINENLVDKEIIIGDKAFALTSLHLGVPHTIVYCDINNENFKYGPMIEKHEIFKNKTNVNFVEVVSKNEIRVKTWERGAGETLACGTGSCASVVVSNLLGHTDKAVKVNVPGGEMYIEMQDERVYMTGPAEFIFEGIIEL